MFGKTILLAALACACGAAHAQTTDDFNRDDGPGLGHVVARSSLGLSITRALVASFGGSLDLRPRRTRGVVATIEVPYQLAAK